jgi:hypothetical protein
MEVAEHKPLVRSLLELLAETSRQVTAAPHRSGAPHPVEEFIALQFEARKLSAHRCQSRLHTGNVLCRLSGLRTLDWPMAHRGVACRIVREVPVHSQFALKQLELAAHPSDLGVQSDQAPLDKPHDPTVSRRKARIVDLAGRCVNRCPYLMP